jgi:hypothetical protein
MPSPFPGMDPYLEGPRLWRDFHTQFITDLREALNPQIRPNYVARIEARVYISDADDPGRRVIVPDFHVAKSGTTAPAAHRAAAKPVPDDLSPAIEIVELIDAEITEPYIEIIDTANREVVTVIEVLSPTNKIRGSRGREEYQRKRERVIKSRASLVEIDLLRAGEPVFVGQALPTHDYMVLLSRPRQQRRRTLVWPIQLAQRLPVVPAPLRDADGDAKLNLQAVFAMTYDHGEYGADINYQQPPDVPLSLEAARWADEVLTSKGLRK